MANQDLANQHLRHGNLGFSFERPNHHRACVVLSRPGEPFLSVGTVGLQDEENLKERDENEEDFITTRLIIREEESWWSRYILNFAVHYHDENNVYQTSTLRAIFDDQSLNKVPGHFNLQACHVSVREYYLNMLPKDNPIRAQINAIISGEDSSTMWALEFDPNENYHGENLYTFHTYGTLQPTVKAIRQRFRIAEPFTIFVTAPIFAEQVIATNIPLQKAFNGNDPVLAYINGNRSKPVASFSVNRGEIAPTDIRPRLAVPAQTTFKALLQWQLAMGCAITQEFEHEKRSTEQLKTFKCYIVALQGHEGHSYFAIVNWEGSDETDYRPRPGDTVRVAFNNLTQEDQKWRGLVVRSLPGMNVDQIGIFVRRPRRLGVPVKFEPEVVPHLTFAEAAALKKQDVLKALKKSTPTPIDIFPDINDKNTARQWKALGAITTIQKEASDYAKMLRDLLLGKAPIDLPRLNLFSLFANPNVVYQQIAAKLSPEQLKILDACTAAPGGIVNVDGPAGTGKTTTALLIAAAIAMEFRVLITAPVNQIVDNLYEKVNKAFDEWIKENEPETQRVRLVMRIYAINSEVTVVQRDADILRGFGVEQKLDIDTSEVDEMLFGGTLMKHHREAFSFPHFPVLDRRVVKLDASLGEHMAIRAGIRKDPRTNKQYSWARPDRHANFVNLYDRYSQKGNYFTPDEKKEFSLSINTLRADTLSIASIVVTTLSNAALDKIHTNFKPQLLIIDESSKASEPETLPGLVFYRGFQACMLLGDAQQLRPLVKSTGVDSEGYAKNSFASQLQMSFYTRLRLFGHPTILNNQQHRYCQEIQDIISPVFYNNRLVQGNIDQSEVAKAKKVNKKLFKKSANAILIAMNNTWSIATPANPSRYNVREAAATIQVLEKYLNAGIKPEDIGLLTPYESQYGLLLKGVTELGHHRKQDLSKVMVSKFDGMVGDERKYLIISLTITDKLGFLQSPFRINTAFSRGQFSIAVVLNLKGLERVHHYDDTKLAEAIELMKPNMYNFTSELDIPNYIKHIFPDFVEPKKDTEGTQLDLEEEFGQAAVPFIPLPDNHPDYEAVKAELMQQQIDFMLAKRLQAGGGRKAWRRS